VEPQILLTMDWESSLSSVISGRTSALLLVSSGAEGRGTLARAKAVIGLSLKMVIADVPSAPDIDFVTRLFSRLKGQHFDVVVALGGGSVIDVAKACVLCQNCQTVTDLRDQIQLGEIQLRLKTPDIIAIPTTAGSGSEVTSFATIWDRGGSSKKSIQAAGLTPRYAIIDPTLLHTLKDKQLLYPSLDAASHAIESLWSRRRTLSSRRNAMESLSRTSVAFAHMHAGDRDKAYGPLSQASLYAGLAIAEARTAIAHSISYPLTLEFGVPHGLAASFSLTAIWKIVGKSLIIQPEESAAVSNVLDQIANMRLGLEISTYCNLKSMLPLIPRMRTAGRSDNFLTTVDDGTLENVLVDSMSVDNQTT
jgi:alcohol dehydrogenase class IV